MGRKPKYKPSARDKRIWELVNHPALDFRLDRVCAMYMMSKEQILKIYKQYDEFISASSKSVSNSGEQSPSD